MSTSKKFSASQKGLAPILIVILAAALALGGYLVYQNQTKPTTPPQPTTQPSPSPSNVTHESTTSGETANWIRYINKDWGISFMYPPDYTLTIPDTSRVIGCENLCLGTIFLSSTSSEKQQLQTCLSSGHGCPVYPLKISFNEYAKGKDESLKSVLSKKGFLMNIQYTQTTVDSLSAIEIVKPFNSLQTVFVDRGINIVSIQIGAGSIEGNNTVILESIYKTIQFIKKK